MKLALVWRRITLLAVQAYALRIIEQCSGAPWVLKCLIFVIFVTFLGGYRFCHFRHFLGWSLAWGFRTSLFPNLSPSYLEFISIVVSSRWLEKVRHAKQYRGKLT